MRVRLESAEQQRMERGKRGGKRRRAEGAEAPAPSEAIDALRDRLASHVKEWGDRLENDPMQFGAIEREIHSMVAKDAAVLVAGLLAQVSERQSFAAKTDQAIADAEAPLQAVQKKDDP